MDEPMIYVPLHPNDPRKPFALAEPDSCAVCGARRREHGWRYHRVGAEHGWAEYVAPDDATRLARMKARAEARGKFGNSRIAEAT